MARNRDMLSMHYVDTFKDRAKFNSSYYRIEPLSSRSEWGR